MQEEYANRIIEAIRQRCTAERVDGISNIKASVHCSHEQYGSRPLLIVRYIQEPYIREQVMPFDIDSAETVHFTPINVFVDKVIHSMTNLGEIYKRNRPFVDLRRHRQI